MKSEKLNHYDGSGLMREVADDPRNQKHADVLKAVVSGDENALKEKMTSGEVDDLIDRIDQYSTHPATLKTLTELLGTVDQIAPMRYFRKFWNKLPHLAQWGLMHSTKGPNLFSSRGPIQTLIRLGFIDYKGHMNEDGKIMEEKIAAMGGFDKFMFKYGVKVGKYFIPELAPLEPFVGPLLKLDNIADKMMSQNRQYLRAQHEIIEKPEKNIENISDTSRSQMESYSLLPAEKKSAKNSPKRLN